MVRLETGDTGVAVTADSDGALYSGMFGVDNYVVSTGNKFKAEIQSNNKIKISDGSAIMNGRHIRVPAGDSELVTINNGSQGMNRIDLIVLRYKKELTGVESGSLVVIQGEETASEPKAPDHVNGDILTGATQADFPLYEVKLEGINITDIKPLFQIIGNITELEKKFAELNGKIEKPILYSSTEKQIGVTDSDQAIYRKTIYANMGGFTKPSSGYQQADLGTGVIIGKLLNVNCHIIGFKNYALPYCANGTAWGTWLNTVEKVGTQHVLRFHNNIDWGSGYTLVATIDYTK